MTSSIYSILNCVAIIVASMLTCECLPGIDSYISGEDVTMMIFTLALEGGSSDMVSMIFILTQELGTLDRELMALGLCNASMARKAGSMLGIIHNFILSVPTGQRGG